MSRRIIPVEVRAKVVRHLLLAWKVKAIAQECEVSLRYVYEIKNNLAKYAQSTRPALVKRGRPPRFNATTQAILVDYAKCNPKKTQREMVRFLEEEHGIKASQASVSRVLKPNGPRKKRASRTPKMQSHEVCAERPEAV